ncbi:MAG TPA: LysE family translocator [Vicinamibacterales bacterium]|nr:LysE family translocator [Vicinamibacterales bacterium]
MDSLFLGYLSLTVALAITPGATTALVVRNTLASGWRGGITAALGAGLANITYATAAGLGLAVFVSHVPALLVAIRVAGGLYLAWLGVAGLRRIITGAALPIAGAIMSGKDTIARHHAFREGLAVNLLNPAIATFYLAVVPAFIPPGAAHTYYARLAAVHVSIAFICHSIWAFSMDRLRHLLTHPTARLVLEGLTAAALLLLAAKVLLSAA